MSRDAKIALAGVGTFAGLSLLPALAAVFFPGWVFIVACVIFVSGTLVVSLAVTATWVASGEPDVNGDPERDATESVSRRHEIRRHSHQAHYPTNPPLPRGTIQGHRHA